MGVSAGKLVIGSSVAYEKPTVNNTDNTVAVRSLSDLHNDADSAPIATPAERRLSSYFVVNKESDYLDHNIRNNRR